MSLNDIYNAGNSVLTNSHKIYARLYLANASVFFSPHYLQIIDIENIQRNFTVWLNYLKNVNYVGRQNIISHDSLELHRLCMI